MNDNNNKTIEANNFKFKFLIEGKLNKDLPKTSIQKEFKLSEIDSKANCTFSIGENKNANLNCELNAEKYKKIKTFSLLTSEINTKEGDEIYFDKLNEIILMNTEEKDKKNNKNLIIIISVICGVIFLIAISIVIFFIVKKRNSKDINIIDNKNNLQREDKVNEIKEKKENDNSKNIILKT